MPHQLHSAPAAAAMILVVCIATVTFMILVLLPGMSLPTHHVIAIPAVGTHIRNITRAAGIVMLLGYLSGIAGWIVMLVLRCDGMHRLASVQSVRQQY